MDDVFSHKGRRFRRRSQPLPGNHNFTYTPSPPPPPPPSQPNLSRSVLLPPPVNVSKGRPMSAKTRLHPTKLDPSDHRLHFALQNSQPLPPIPDTTTTSNSSSNTIYEVDSAVDLDYISQCDTPLIPPHPMYYYTHYPSDSLFDQSTSNSPKFLGDIQTTVHSNSPKFLGERQTITTVQLGLKLPNSERIEHSFPLTATIQDIIDYAQNHSSSDNVSLQDCIVSINGLTKTVLHNKYMTLEECGINVRTILYLTLP